MMRDRRFPALVGLGLALLLGAWVVATRPFQAPDEPSHYLRAAGIASGQWLGPKAPYPAPWLPPAQRAWAQQGARAVRIPARLTPPYGDCRVVQPRARTCLEVTSVGNYHPLPYLLPAVAIAASPASSTALWLSRASSALQCLVFILLAVALLWNGSPWPLIGLLAAITPMVLFVSSVINPNGLEVAASLALAAAVLRVSRGDGPVQRWVWAAAAVSGAATILSWQLGPVFALADLGLLAGLVGRRGLRELTRSRGIWWAVGALILATLVWLGYSLVSGVDHARLDVSLLHAHGGLTQLLPVLRDSVGDFGLTTVPLPVAARWIWWLLVLGLAGAAAWASRARARAVLAAVSALALAFPILFYSWVYRFSGFGLQGRYLLPLLILVPLLAGELIGRRTEHSLPGPVSQLLPAVLIAVIAGFQAYAWWYAAGIEAGAARELRFYAHASWSPPLGWITWLVVGALGVAALLTGALSVALRATQRPLLARVGRGARGMT